MDKLLHYINKYSDQYFNEIKKSFVISYHVMTEIYNIVLTDSMIGPSFALVP